MPIVETPRLRGTTSSRLPLWLGGAACAACCAIPLTASLAGAGLAAGVATVAEPLAGLLAIAGIGFAGRAIWQRQRSAPRGAAERRCAADGSCGCGPRVDPSAAGAGCTLPGDAARRARVAEFEALFARGLRRREASAGRVRWIFAWSPTLERDARSLAAAEAECCGFLHSELRRAGDELHWELRAAPGQHSVLQALDGAAAESMVSSRAG